jgi:hypothetical protein
MKKYPETLASPHGSRRDEVAGPTRGALEPASRFALLAVLAVAGGGGCAAEQTYDTGLGTTSSGTPDTTGFPTAGSGWTSGGSTSGGTDGADGAVTGSTTASSTGETGGGNSLEDQYPDLYDEDLPFNGLFYGFPFSGDNFELARIGGSEYGNELSLRFRAERSGLVTFIGYNNRYDPEGNGYSTGDGGVIHAELREDDGTENHLPVDTAFATTNSHVPASGGQFIRLELAKPVPITAGALYHVVFVQETDRYASTNGGSIFVPEDPVGGPYYANDNLMFHRNEGVWTPSNSKGAPDTKVGQSYCTIGYSDGVEVGTGGWAYANNYPRIGGSNHIRQVFVVHGPTRHVDGVWFRLGRRPGNDAPLIVELKDDGDEGGSVLASRSVPASETSEGTIASTQDVTIRWTYADFGTVVPLARGSTYSVEMTSPDSPSDGYNIHAYVDLVAYGSNEDRNMWSDATAEISSNGGGSWTATIENANNDFGFGLTLEGGPRSIPSTAAWWGGPS